MAAQCRRPSNILIVVAIMVDASQIYEFLIFFLFLIEKDIEGSSMEIVTTIETGLSKTCFSDIIDRGGNRIV